MTKTFEWGDNLPVLGGKRFDLTPMIVDDAPQILELFGDPKVMRYWGKSPFKDIGAAQYFIEGTIENSSDSKSFCWGIRWRATGRVISTSTLLNIDREHKRGEIGFAVTRGFWGKGVATEAVEKLLAFAFEILNLHRIEADVDPRNLASLRVLEKQGFVREGLLRERWHQMGEIQDSVLLGLLKREWRRGGNQRSI